MDVARATSVLAAAKEHGVFRQEMPQDDDVRIDKASSLVRQAQAAYSSNVRLPSILAVLGAANVSTENERVVEPETVIEDTIPQLEEVSIEQHVDDALETKLELAMLEDEEPITLPERERGGFNENAEKDQWECADCDYACRTERGIKMHMRKAEHSIVPLTQRIDGQITVDEMLEDIENESTGIPEETQEASAPAPKNASISDAIKYVHTERALAKIDGMKLPKPQEFEGDPPQRPVDMSIMSMEELRKLYSSFNACSAYARWHAAMEAAKADDAKRIIAKKKRQIMATIDHTDAKGKPKPVTILENEAIESSPELQEWMERQAEHITTAAMLNAMLESYDLDCSRISRDMAARHTELAHS